MNSTLWKIGLTLSLAIGSLVSTHARTDCPPVPQEPTPQQMADGFRDARDRGAMWTITKDGRTSHLYGTLHVGKMGWAFPGPRLMQVLRETQVLVLGLDPTDPALPAQMQADAACSPREALRPLHPLMQGITYTVLSARRDGLDPAFGQEFTLVGFARAQQRHIVSLETMTSQMSVRLPRDAAAARASFERMLGDLASGKGRTPLLRISEAWSRGDLQLLESLEAPCDCQPTPEERQFARLINDARNPHLARRIAEQHAKGRPILAAVGILHMTGPQAVTTLLEQQGFEVKRVSY